MNRSDAEKITAGYLNPVFGFALKRCKNLEDAEDLAQDIIVKIFIALIKCDDIENISSFIWTIAHNSLSNYYRNNNHSFTMIPIDDADRLCNDSPSVDSSLIEYEETAKLHTEIAYLSKLQRRIVIMYYYENKKQEQISEELNIPVGTVKWHLFEAKKELKKGMEIMRESSELRFNPIKFDMCTFSGKIGTKGDISNFFRSAISQNIVYTVRNQAKSINEIADELGVSPVYVESEAEYLEEYGFLLKQKNKYLCNILISEPTEQINRLQDEMYMKAAKIFANELYDELMGLDLMNFDGILGGCNDVKDNNFLMWALIPFITAFSNENTMDKPISFSDVYTIRPDGGKNICYAYVAAPDVKPPMYNEEMKKFKGPIWNGLTDKITLWTVDSEWSGKRIEDNYHVSVVRDLTLLHNYLNDVILSEDDYAYLVEKDYISISGNPDKLFKTNLRIIYIKDDKSQKDLLAVGNKIKEKYKAEFEKLKSPYIKAVLENTPKHLHKMRMYGLQHIFYSDAWFILHCLKELTDSNKLNLPTENQKRALTTILFKQ